MKTPPAQMTNCIFRDKCEMSMPKIKILELLPVPVAVPVPDPAAMVPPEDGPVVNVSVA